MHEAVHLFFLCTNVFYEHFFSPSKVQGHACVFIKMRAEMTWTRATVRINGKKWSRGSERHPGGKKGEAVLARLVNRQLK